MGAAALAELWIVVALALLATAAGLVFDDITVAVGAVLGAYLAWHLRGVWRLVRALPDDAEMPQSLGIWGYVYDRLYRARREAAARQRHLAMVLARFEESAAALPDAAVVLGPDHTIQWCNEAASHLLGLELARDRGQRITNVVRHPAFQAYLADDPSHGAVEFPASVGDDVVAHAQLIAYGHGRHLLVVRDVTELRRLDQVRRDFVANASHELRTPLTVVYGFVETLHAEQAVLPERWLRPVELMRQQTARMQRIVDDMLVLARMESQAGRAAGAEVPVPQLLDAIRREALVLSGAHGHRIALAADAALWLAGNEAELRSAFSNLVFNAVQHTPDGTGIDITWGQAPDGSVRASVQDHGEGIAPEHIPRLTERFYRVETSRSRARGGTGLGLAIVKHALARHGGELIVESTPGHGARFTCVFPASLGRRRSQDAPSARQRA